MKRIITLACAAAVASSGLLLAGTGAAVAHPAAGTLPQVDVTMNGKSIQVSGALQSGGVTVMSAVTGEPQGLPMFIRLNPGVTVAQFFAAFRASQGDAGAVTSVGAIVFGAQAGKGISSAQVSLDPGQYVAMDTVASNPAHWPVTTFTVSPAATPAALPTPAASIWAIEFGFTGPGILRDGQLVRFGNRGWLVHMIFGARASSLAGADQIAALLRAGHDNQAQRLADNFYGFAGPLSHGAAQQFTLNVQPGYWVIACFMDTQDHREHTTLGMVRVIRIAG